MDINDLRGKSRADQLRIAAEFAGVAPSVFDGIDRTESSHGVNMTSSKGARGHFGVMPGTQATWEKRTGLKLDANDFTDGLFLAANQLKENLGATKGNLPDALRMYNGGTDRSNWQNQETQEYVGKVLGTDFGAQHAAVRAKVHGAALTTEDLKNISTADFFNMASDDLGRLRPTHMEAAPTQAVVNASHIEVAPNAQSDKSLEPERTAANNAEGAALFEQNKKNSYSATDKFVASVTDNTLTAGIVRSLVRKHEAEDPNWPRYYSDNRAEFEKDLHTQDEVNWMRESTSQGDADRIAGEIAAKRQREAVYGSGGKTSAILWGLAGGVADPAGWALGLGAGKALEVAGVGSRVLLAGREARAATEAFEGQFVSTRSLEFNPASGQFEPAGVMRKNPLAGLADPGTGAIQPDWIPHMVTIPGTKAVTAIPKNVPAGIASAVGEQTGVNLLTTAAIDASGEHESTNDYAFAAGTGLLMAGLHSSLHVLGTPDPHLVEQGMAMRQAAAERDAANMLRAQENLGPDATSDALAAEATRLQRNAVVDQVRASLAEVPESQRLLPEDMSNLLTSDKAVKDDVHSRYDLAAVSDDAERDLVAEHIAQAERIVKDNPINDAGLKTILQKIKVGSPEGQGLESTGLTLLNSKSPTARAVSMMLLEGTTGAGGRRRTAAMSQIIRERLYNQQVHGYDELYHQWRRANGYNLVSEAFDGKGRAEFNKRVFLAIEERGRDVRTEADPIITQAADTMEKGFDLMRTEQQHVGTAGAARLGESSVGYAPHKLDIRQVARLTNEQSQVLRNILSDQFVDPQNGFDRKFSDMLAAKYLEVARNKGAGSYDVPMNLHDAEAADIIEDISRALTPEAADRLKLFGKFSRGGAAHTKKRLRFDLTTPIPDADGVIRDKRLVDLYSTDLPSLYRSYARRTSGEVALAQYGIMGKKGLNMLRVAMQRDGATHADLKAFDQIAAEFLNTPFGEHNHKFMDNLRMAASLSRLGGMGFTQFAEYGNSIAALGIHRTFGAIAALPRMLKEVGQIKANGEAKNPILNSLETLGGHFGMDDYHLTRLFDVKDNDIKMYGVENVSVWDRALRAGVNAQGIMSFHRAILATQIRGMAEQIIHKAVDFAKLGTEDKHLADMGIHGELLAALRSDLPHIAEFDARGKLKSLDFSKTTMDPGQVMELRQAIERGSSQIIQRTYIGETGRWANDGLLKMLLQFRTFGVTSIEKQWGRNVANHGTPAALGYLLGSMSFAAPIYLARVHAKTVGMGRSDREDYIKKNTGVLQIARATMNYASASGLAGDIMDVGAGFAGSLGGDPGRDFADSVGARGQARNSLIGGVLGPGAGVMEDTWKGIHGDHHKLMRVLPFSNLPLMQPFVNAVSPPAQH